MIRSVDRTGWISDNQASIIVNLGDPIPTNVVETFSRTPTVGWGKRSIWRLPPERTTTTPRFLASSHRHLGVLSDVINDAGDSICTDGPDYNSPEFDAGVVAYDNADLQPRSEVNQASGDLGRSTRQRRLLLLSL